MFKASEGKFSLHDSNEIKNEFKSIVDSSLYSLERKDDKDTLIYDHLGEKNGLFTYVWYDHPEQQLHHQYYDW